MAEAKKVENYQLLTINWQRIYLHLTINSTASNNGTLAVEETTTGKISSLLFEKQNDDWSFIIARAAGREFLPNGMYRFGIIEADKTFRPLAIGEQMVSQLDSLTRIFYYGRHEAFCYNVSFTAVYQDGMIQPIMKIRFMKDNPTPEKLHVNTGVKSVKEKIHNRLEVIIKSMIGFVYWIGSHLAVHNGKRVLFFVQTHKGLGGNLQAVKDALEARHSDYQIFVFVCDLLSPGLHLSSWIKSTLILCNKDYIFVDDYEPILSFVQLDKRTKLIQLWHAGVGFKSSGYSRYGHEDAPHPYRMSHRQIDVAVVGALDLIPDYEEAFGIEKSAFLPVGLPRLQGYKTDEKQAKFRQEFYQRYPQLKDKKIILFAPTFRGKGGRDAYYDFEVIDFKQLKPLFEQGYRLIFKFHFFVTAKITIPAEYQQYCYDMSDCGDINQLFYITDILITDYSSCIYEFALFKKPIVFLAYDEMEYNLQRGIYRPLSSFAPGKICHSFTEMVQAISNQDFETEKLDEFVRRYHVQDQNHIADRIIDGILPQLGGEKCTK